MKNKTRPNLMKVSYKQVEANPKEIEVRTSRAFEILFNEVIRINQASKFKSNCSYEINTTKIQ